MFGKGLGINGCFGLRRLLHRFVHRQRTGLRTEGRGLSEGFAWTLPPTILVCPNVSECVQNESNRISPRERTGGVGEGLKKPNFPVLKPNNSVSFRFLDWEIRFGSDSNPVSARSFVLYASHPFVFESVLERWNSLRGRYGGERGFLRWR